MSMIDSRWEIWDNQALTSAEESRSNGNMLDLEENGVTDESIGPLLWCNIQVGTTFATLTSGVNIEIITSDSATFASGVRCVGSFGGKTYPILVGGLAAGAVFSMAIPVYTLNKYLELYWEPINEAASAGKLDAWFGLSPLSSLKVQKAPGGYTIA